MVMEIKPVAGQPGLFQQKGLNGTRWTSTFTGPMFNAPFGTHRKRSGFGAIALPIEYVQKSRADNVTQNDIAAGMSPGIGFVAYIPLKAEPIPQASLDSVFRSLFAQQGFDVSGSTLDVASVAYQWKYDPTNKIWEALPVAGPLEWVQRAPPAAQTTGTPVPKDLENAAKGVAVYKLLLRPKDLSISPAKVDAALAGARQAARGAGWTNVLLSADIRGVQPPAEAPKPFIASIAPWIGLIGVGWIATLAARGKIER